VTGTFTVTSEWWTSQWTGGSSVGEMTRRSSFESRKSQINHRHHQVHTDSGAYPSSYTIAPGDTYSMSKAVGAWS